MSTFWFFCVTAAVRARKRQSVWRMEWREYLFPTNLQILQQFWYIHRRWSPSKGQETHSCMVCFASTTTYYLHLSLFVTLSLLIKKEFYFYLKWRCDRILWYGSGLNQLSYVRGESRFSDHRPVYSLFSVEVDSVYRNRIKKSSSYSSSRVEVEELLPQRYEINPYWFKHTFAKPWK